MQEQRDDGHKMPFVVLFVASASYTHVAHSKLKRTQLPGGSPVDFPESDTDVTIRDSASASGHYTSRRKPVQDIHAIQVQGGG